MIFLFNISQYFCSIWCLTEIVLILYEYHVSFFGRYHMVINALIAFRLHRIVIYHNGVIEGAFYIQIYLHYT